MDWAVMSNAEIISGNGNVRAQHHWGLEHRFIRHSEVTSYLNAGWLALDTLSGCHHGAWSVHCIWLCDCPVVVPDTHLDTQHPPALETDHGRGAMSRRPDYAPAANASARPTSKVEVAVPWLDAKALETDPEGLALLRSVLEDARPCPSDVLCGPTSR